MLCEMYLRLEFEGQNLEQELNVLNGLQIFPSPYNRTLQSCFGIILDRVTQNPALLLRIKASALQKRPLFVLFALVGLTAAILDLALLCAVQDAQCKTRELP